MSILATFENTPAAWTRRANESETPWEACGWSRDSQEARFMKIRDSLLPRFTRDVSILDYGCGTGGLSEHFEECDYLGYDWSLGMISRARGEHPRAEFTTMLRDGDTWDFVVCCGTFNLADNWSKAETWALMRMLWNRTRRAMAVSLYCGNDPACIRYAPSEAATTAGVMAHKFTIERGYLPNDLLVVMRR